MEIKDTIKTAFTGLTTHKSRSVLTILGIVIGITSITLVTAIGQSAENLILGEIQSLGPNNVFIIPGREPRGPSGIGGTLLNDSIKERDMELLRKKSNVPDATKVVPFVFGPAVVSYDSETEAITVLGSTPEMLDIYGLEVKEGFSFSGDDVTQSTEVVIMGNKIAEELFSPEDPLREKIKIKNKSYKIVGILSEKGQSPFIDFDETVIMPYTTAQQHVLGFKYIQRVAITASSVEKIPGMIRDIETTLRDSHNITDPDKDDFFIQTQKDITDTLSMITGVLTALLASIAAISLVVGGVGIMNIMLVSVTERTKEIGLRKALGATNKNILFQFLIEAVMLTVSGGVIGIFMGLGLSYLAVFGAMRFFEVNIPFSIPWSGALLGIGVSTAIGFIFGIYPAKNAASKSPIEALRYE